MPPLLDVFHEFLATDVLITTDPQVCKGQPCSISLMLKESNGKELALGKNGDLCGICGFTSKASNKN